MTRKALQHKRVSYTSELVGFSAGRLVELYRSKALSPVEVTDATLRQIEMFDPGVNAFRVVTAEEARSAARLSESRWMKGEPVGLLDGVPTTIKDVSQTIGVSTLLGSRTVKAEGPWREDAPIVARLREHGAVFLGKTTTPEFGWKGVTDSPLTGISRNPWHSERTCGGSSGGAAIAAAAGMGVLHQAGDGAGSIRIPACFCGVYGLKPTFGRVPRAPLGAGAAMMVNNHNGPITRNVEDAALMMNVITLPDRRDWLSVEYDPRDYRRNLDEPIKGLRIAYSRDLGFAKIDPEIADIVKKAVSSLEELGALVEECTPGFPDPRDALEVQYFSKFANMFRQLNLSDSQYRVMDPGLVEIAERGKHYTIQDLYDSWRARDSLGAVMSTFFGRFDLLVTPQLPVEAFEVGRDCPAGYGSGKFLDWMNLCYPFNLTQQPAASVPCGFTSNGLPVGLQIIGPKYSEALIMRVSRAFEKMRPFIMPE